MGDKFELSGNFQGAILNIKSRLENVQQSIGSIKTQDDDSLVELQKLIDQLNQILQQVPQEKQEEATAVAKTTEALVEQVKEEQPNKTMIQITGEGLKKAAQNLADVLPTVVPIAAQIVAVVGKLSA
ncbi:MAG: hypothetical protein PVG14_04655 [Anaerolineales bacterium]|jgi:hypothetical protein